MKILFIVDRPNWAWDIKSQNISKVLNKEFEFKIIYEKDVSGKFNSIDKKHFSWCDILVVYGLYQSDHYLKKKLDKKIKICQGISTCDEVKNKKDEDKLIDISNKVDAIFVHNKNLLNKFEDKISNLFYCPNGVDTEVFKSFNPINKKLSKLTLGFVGNSKSRNDKGIYDIIEPACKKLENVNLKVLDLAKGKVISYKEMPDFYNSIDCYLCASKLEGTPNPCLEAAACGRPLITTRVGNMPELVLDNENSMFAERSIDGFVGKISEYKNNRNKLIEHGKEIQKEIISNWSWKRQAKNYKYMFNKIFDKSTKTFQVIVISCGEPQFKDCLNSVKSQTLEPEKIDIIKDITPMTEAYNQALKLITCDYVIILNADMILYENAFEIMVSKMESINQKNIFGVYYKLEDPIYGKIGNLKIVKSDIVKKLKHENKTGHDRLFDEKLEKKGYIYKRVDKVLATHCQNASENQVFKRSLGVGKKVVKFKKDHLMIKKIMKSIAKKWVIEENDLAFYALAGYFIGLMKIHSEEERDFDEFGIEEWENLKWIVEEEERSRKISSSKFNL